MRKERKMKKQNNTNKTLPNEPRVIVDEPNVEDETEVEQLRINQQTASINVTQVGPTSATGRQPYIDDTQNESSDVFSRLAQGRQHKHTSSATHTAAA